MFHIFICYVCHELLLFEILIWRTANRTPPTSLSTNVHYERMMDMFNIKGHFCIDIPQLQDALEQSLQVSWIFLFWYLFNIKNLQMSVRCNTECYSQKLIMPVCESTDYECCFRWKMHLLSSMWWSTHQLIACHRTSLGSPSPNSENQL